MSKACSVLVLFVPLFSFTRVSRGNPIGNGVDHGRFAVKSSCANGKSKKKAKI